MNSPSLDAIGRKYRTDKSSILHDYLSFYERFFAPYRGRAPKVLEIGIFHGASLNVWEEYFENADIVAADINPATVRFERPGVKIEILDQSNIEELVRLAVKHGPFDIIIEDGSHMWEHQTTTFKTLFPFLKNGGYYIAEDLQTNYESMADQYQGVATESCVEYLKKLVDLRVADNRVDISAVEDPFLRTYGRAMGFMAFYKMACLIQKDYRDERKTINLEFLHAPLIETNSAADAPTLRLCAHIGNIGDVYSRERCSIRAGVKPAGAVQGFALFTDDALISQIQYRALGPNGVWGQWMPAHQFAGTRAKKQNLHGYSVKLSGPLAERWSLAPSGWFEGEATPRQFAEGEDCVAPDSSAALIGMQINLTAKS